MYLQYVEINAKVNYSKIRLKINQNFVNLNKIFSFKYFLG